MIERIGVLLCYNCCNAILYTMCTFVTIIVHIVYNVKQEE